MMEFQEVGHCDRKKQVCPKTPSHFAWSLCPLALQAVQEPLPKGEW